MKLKANLALLLFLSFSLVIISCGGEEKGSQDTPESTENAEELKQEIKLSPFSDSPEFSDATIAVDVSENQYNYTVGGNYQLGEQTTDAPQKMCANSGKGQHIHLIVDDKPYAAKYEASFEHEVEDGEHYVLSFLSRSYHESIKNGTAHVAFKANYTAGTPENRGDIDGPMLFYSRPKGTYVGKSDTEKIMLDFFLLNTALAADGNKVKVEVNGESEFVVDDWKPYFLEGLPMGDNKVKLTLIDAEGNPLDIPLNPVERVFTLKPDPAE